ncbi:ABC transporter permease [Paenibacillus sp. Soil724D2]|uniref:ABC transporter permease n=1 Tax=Paenibacillus sp. (strain Soil724D2) TaxID=1736392 RepID=UPI00071381F9|nr:ABC transporter permease subunit [Paenibacillus sp. Soil724D2]KRE48480.1 protein lplB [Paenibacillus sp. Soil724D2]
MQNTVSHAKYKGRLKGKTNRKWQEIVRHKYFYLMVFPTVLFFLIFAYVPMYGVILAFKDFNYSLGIMNSPWNNFQNFRDVLGDPKFLHAFNNTLLISFGRLLIEFPIPILLAILLNEMRHRKLKRIYQTVFTFPHFISWVVLSGIITSILSDQGVLNQILQLFGWGKNTILVHDGSFLALLFTSNIWKEAGWSSIIYLAAIAGINPELYEAAAIDGATRYQQMKAITWPVIRTTAAILLILAVGGIMNGGFDQIFNLYNPAVYERADILDTYVYRSAFVDSTGFGYSTTVGLLKSVINCLLLFGANYFVKHVLKEEGL